MEAVVAIWILIAHNDGYKAASSIVSEFNSEETCRSALKTLKQYQKENTGSYSYAFCVEK